MLRKIALVGLSLLLALGVLGSPTLAANAAVTKTAQIDCNETDGTWNWGTVYLFPQETLTMNFVNCNWELYVDTDPDPSVNDLSPIRGDADGFITFSADGTYVISSDMPEVGVHRWFTDGQSANYIYFEPFFTPNPVAFFEISVAKNDVTSVPGKTLLSSPAIQFPARIDSSNLMGWDQNLSECILDPSSSPYSQSDTFVFVETPFSTNVSGDVTIRTISTTPVTSFTNYLLEPDGYQGGTPMIFVNHLVYEHFDPEHPAEGLIGCGQERDGGGDFLQSGEILSDNYFETTLNLEAGDYTIVSAVAFPMSVDEWNPHEIVDPFGSTFISFEGQSVNVQIWVPAQLSTAATPVLASTGAHSWLGNAALVILTLGFTLVLLKRRRTQKA